MNHETELAWALARVMRGADTWEFKLRMHVLLRKDLEGREITHADLGRNLDILELPLSTRQAARSLVDAGLADPTERGIRFGDRVNDVEDSTGSTAGVTLDELRKLFVAQMPPPVSSAAVLDAIRRAAAWVSSITETASRAGLAGLPVFWTEQPDGSYRPFSNDIGSIATVDGLLMILNGLRVSTLPQPSWNAAAAILVESLLDMQGTSSAWHDGSVVVPAWDDDFVGTYVPAHNDRGPCPTLDSTACFASALSRARTSLIADRLPSAVDAALERAVRCILRWQNDDGSWSVHRYDPNGQRWTMPARTMSMVYAAEALALCRRHVSVDVASAATSALTFLRERAKSDGDAAFWTLDFHARASGTEVAATALAIPSIIALASITGENVEDLVGRATTFVLAEWKPNADAYLRIPFRVPTWEGPALDEFAWELPTDPLVVSALLASRLTERSLALPDWTRIACSIGSFLERCQPGGFWVDLLMLKEGDVRGMTGNSDYFQTALVDYLTSEQAFYDRLPDLTYSPSTGL